MVHKIVIGKEYADEIAWGNKTFVLTDNENYKQGDTIELTVIAHTEDGIVFLSKHPIFRKSFEITYVLEAAQGLREGYCVLGIKDPDSDWKRVDKETQEISRAVAKLRELIARNQ